LLSALAHGLPVISTGARTPCPGVQVTPIGDVAALAQAMVEWSADRQRVARLGVEARAFAATLSWDAIARQVVAVFETTRRA
jgi:glycosyltransferase involved in cell wall biosynthesis